MRKRGLASPDLADALVLTFAGPASIMAGHSSAAYNWNTPLRRNLAVT